MVRDRLVAHPADTTEDVEPQDGDPPAPRKRLALLVAGRIPDPKDSSKKWQIRKKMEASLEACQGDGLAEHFLTEARRRYEDVFKRAENLERRAGTLQTGVVFAVTFTLTGGGLLLDTDKIGDRAWRVILALAVVAVVGLFVWSGLHATLAAARTEYWKVVGRFSLQERPYDNVDEARLRRAAAYIWCVNQNMPVNTWKATELGRSLKAFIAGLAGLVVVALILLLVAITA